MTLVPFGGIGNRISAIESALRLAGGKGYSLSVVWFKDWGMKAQFQDLFMPLDSCSVTGRPSVFDRISLERPRKHNLFIPAPFQGMMFDKCFYGDRRYISGEELLEAPRVYIASCYEFYKGETDYSIFHPSDKVSKRLKELTKDFSSSMVALHVRRGDHTGSIEKSPLSLFEEKMQAEDPETRFYLSTDSEEVKQELKSKFSDRIITDPITIPRGSLEAEVEAAAEMFAISRCQKVYGSFNSSFGLRAAEIGRIPFKCLSNE